MWKISWPVLLRIMADLPNYIEKDDPEGNTGDNGSKTPKENENLTPENSDKFKQFIHGLQASQKK